MLIFVGAVCSFTVGADCYVVCSCWITEYANSVAILKDSPETS